MLDTYDYHNPKNPINQNELEPLSELEELENNYNELRYKLIKARKDLKFCINLAENGTNTLLLNNLKKIKL